MMMIQMCQHHGVIYDIAGSKFDVIVKLLGLLSDSIIRYWNNDMKRNQKHKTLNWQNEIIRQG